MRRLLALVATGLVSLLVASCEGAPPAAFASGRCPVGHATMGCSLPLPLKGISAPPKGEIVPDVSSYQRTVNWAAVKKWQLSHGWRITGGIFKLGENVIDPYAVANAHALKANHMAAIGYVFVRPSVKASTILGWVKQVGGLRVIVLDEEVPGIDGTAARIAPALKAAGLTVVDYHSLSNVYDTTARGLLCWVAAYGLTKNPGCTTGPERAWQFTDIGSVPGISGQVDESITYGLLKLAGKPTMTKAQRQHFNWLISRRNYWRGQFLRCIFHADGIKCENAEHWWLLRRHQAIMYRAKFA